MVAGIQPVNSEWSDPFETEFTTLSYYWQSYGKVIDAVNERIKSGQQWSDTTASLWQLAFFYSRMIDIAERLWEEAVKRNVRIQGIQMSGVPNLWWYGDDEGFGPRRDTTAGGNFSLGPVNSEVSESTA